MVPETVDDVSSRAASPCADFEYAELPATRRIREAFEQEVAEEKAGGSEAEARTRAHVFQRLPSVLIAEDQPQPILLAS